MNLAYSNKTNQIIAYSIWWVLWMIIQAMVIHQLGYDSTTAITDAALTQIVLAVSGYATNTMLRFYQPKQIVTYIFSWSIAMAVLSVFAQKFVLTYFFSGDERSMFFLKQTFYIRGAFDWLMISFITLTSWLWFYVMDRKEAEKLQADAERLVREAELTDLRNQLQPHFIFNSLNSISALVLSSPETARTMIQQLSDFLRGTIRKDNRTLVTLEEELRHLGLYLEIEKIRFGHRLGTEIHHDDASLRSKIPSLLLQPIVENAVKFGLYDTVGEITIAIRAVKESNYLNIEITNPFDEATSQPRKGTGFGLNSIRRRLYLMYSQNDLLTTHQENGLFSTVIKIPQTA